MNPFQESLARTSASDTKSLQSLLKVAEELLFSFPLPTDIVKKYEFMRESAFSKLGLVHSFSRIWNLQREAHARGRVDKVQVAVQTNPTYDSPETKDPLIRSYRKTIESVLIDLDSFVETIRLILGVQKEEGNPLLISELETYKVRRVPEEDLSETLQLKALQLEINSRVMGFSAVYADLKRAVSLKDRETSLAQAKAAEAVATLSRLTAKYEDQVHALEKKHDIEKTDLENGLSRMREQRATDQGYEDVHRSHLQEIESLLREKDKAQEGFRQLQIEFDRTRANSKLEIEQVHGVYKKEMEFLSQNLRSEIEKMKKTHYNQLEELKTAYERRKLEEEKAQSSYQKSEFGALKQQMKEVEGGAIETKQCLSEIQRRISALYLKYSGNLLPEWKSEEPGTREALLKLIGGRVTSPNFESFLHLEFLSFALSKSWEKVEKLESALETSQQEKRILELRISSRSNRRTSEVYKDVLEDMNYASTVLQEFESARLKLVGQFPQN